MFSEAINFLEAGVERGWHTGGQLCVREQGQVLLDHAFGEASPGMAMRKESILQWFSSGKPITALAIAQLQELGKLKIEDRVTEHMAEFGAGGKGEVQIRHLLNHTAGLRLADKLSPELPWEEMIARICETRIEPGWIAGEKAGYSTQASWYVLGELVRRVSGRPLDEYVRAEIFEPTGMHDSWLRLPREKHRAYANAERLGLLYEKHEVNWSPIAHQDEHGMALLRPGSSARGPVGELAIFYQMLLDGGTVNGQRVVSPESVRLFTKRNREGLYDHTFYHTLDFGLGFLVDSNRYGAETVPYGYGRHSSAEAFGHSGAQSSCGFADPAHGLVVAWVMNGLPGERAHQERARGLNSAIYRDLGLT